ncbi:hypothetical protein [Nocardia cyriacigeorgica]|uniref:Uncharacterized protein n=1 Tax=Nocardia cyriacigeorgica TaxID=135487 RepID=A0A5R8N9Z3_9NOCA|nr:hypothetical protein [Nocardia cyriacigeorgica]MBF6427869.1 hypothetical protein [Nocardia cyriacigeorgica]TLF72446.1 hypothetical protein FEK34_29275 [Nocardia cyriacigeorgica]
MTGPLAGVDRLPGWQRRLLKGVQDLSYEHVRVLTYEFPTYFPGSEGEDLPMRIWRDQLGDVHSQRMQARLRAIDAGIPRETVDAAAEAGAYGIRWADSPHAPPPSQHPELDHIIDHLAYDAYRLEQMAAMHARRATMPGPLRPHPAETGLPEQTRRNMIATAHRAALFAQIADLSEGEAAAFWDRDESAWDRVIGTLMENVGDFAVVEGWRAASWGHIETALTGDIHTLTDMYGLASPPQWWPPDPDTLLARAGAAVARYHDRVATGTAVEHDSAPEAATVVDAAVVIDVEPGIEAESEAAAPPEQQIDPDLGW